MRYNKSKIENSINRIKRIKRIDYEGEKRDKRGKTGTDEKKNEGRTDYININLYYKILQYI